MNVGERIRNAQETDAFFNTVTSYLRKEPIGLKYEGYQILKEGLLTYKNRLYILNCDDLKKFIMDELHKRPYIGHPRYQKMIMTTRKQLEHRHPTGLLQPLPIPEWKWETISMDFITGLPKLTKKNYAIMVVVDKLSKSVDFIFVKSTCKTIDIANIFMKEIFSLHGMPREFVSDRHTKFSSNIWKSLMVGCETKLLFNTAYHPQIDA
jgi:hypothetical protein